MHRTVLSIVFLIAGCAVEPDTATVPLDFSTSLYPNPSQRPLPGLEATAGAGRIQFSGVFGTPTSCYHLTAAASVAGFFITVQVQAVDNGTGCFESLGAYQYSGVVRGLAAGTYRLRVEHLLGDQSLQIVEIPVRLPDP